MKELHQKPQATYHVISYCHHYLEEFYLQSRIGESAPAKFKYLLYTFQHLIFITNNSISITM